MVHEDRIVEELFSRLRYDEATGKLFWNEKSDKQKGYKTFNATLAGKEAGYQDKRGYLVICLNIFSTPHYFYNHRVVWLFINKVWPAKELDHINGIKSDNRKTNLREVDGQLNQKNRSKSCNNKTGVTGVRYREIIVKGVIYSYFIAMWKDKTGRLCDKNFRIESLGAEKAFKLACDHRQKMIESLNESGAGYTARHGT